MGYNVETGWTGLLERQVANYCRAVPFERADIEQLLTSHEIAYYWDAYGGLHAQRTQGELWELLSGLPSDFSSSTPPPTATEWISVTDLGAVFSPPASTSTVLKLLRDEGLLERYEGKDRPTPAAAGLYCEIDAFPSSRFAYRPGAVQRLWAYPVAERLRRRRLTVEAALVAKHNPSKSEKVFVVTLRFAAKCVACTRSFDIGEQAEWNSVTGRFRCIEHTPLPADVEGVV